MRFSVRKRYGYPRLTVMLTLVAILAVYGFWIVENHLKPTLMAFAEAKAIALI